MLEKQAEEFRKANDELADLVLRLAAEIGQQMYEAARLTNDELIKKFGKTLSINAPTGFYKEDVREGEFKEPQYMVVDISRARIPDGNRTMTNLAGNAKEELVVACGSGFIKRLDTSHPFARNLNLREPHSVVSIDGELLAIVAGEARSVLFLQMIEQCSGETMFMRWAKAYEEDFKRHGDREKASHCADAVVAKRIDASLIREELKDDE